VQRLAIACSKVAIYEVPDGQIQQFKAECSIIGVECKVAQNRSDGPDDCLIKKPPLPQPVCPQRGPSHGAVALRT
jgi:hypothetical protein